MQPAEPGPVRAAQPLEPAAHQRVDGQGGQVEGAGPDGLGAVDHEGHPGPAAHPAERGQVDRLPGEGEHPAGAEQPGRRGQLRLQLPGVQHPALGPQQPDPHPALGQGQPGHDRGREVAVHQQDLVPGPPVDPLDQQLQPVAGAVAEDHLAGRDPDQAAQDVLEPARDLGERLVAHPVGSRLVGQRAGGRRHRDQRQRPLVGAVQPGPPVEAAEVPGGVEQRRPAVGAAAHPPGPSAPSWPMSSSPSELTQYSAKRPSRARSRSMPPKATGVPAAAVAPGIPPR